MNGGLDLEQRYRRVLRLLPGYYRDIWEEDMVAAFLDSWLTGDPDEDSVTMEFDRPSRQEIASVASLAARLYLGGAGAPRRYFAWGQAVRGAVLAVLLFHAVTGLEGLVPVFPAGNRYPVIPGPPALILPTSAGGVWAPAVWHLLGCAWTAVFAALVLGHYRTARVIAVLAAAADLAWLLQTQATGTLLTPFGSWAYWFLLDLAPAAAMAAFHRDAPPASRWPWLLALPAGYLLVAEPLLAAQERAPSAWIPDTPGLCCILVSLLCLAHLPRARSSRAGTGVWSLTLVLLAAAAGMYRLVSLGNYLQAPILIRYPHGTFLIHYVHGPLLIRAGLAELLILTIVVALVAPDAARAQTAIPPPPARPQPG